jgi:hypothetical protein
MNENPFQGARLMEVQHPTVILKAVYVSAILVGSVMFGYGLQNPPASDQNTPAAADQPQPPAASQTQDPARQGGQTPTATALQEQQAQADAKPSSQPASGSKADSKSATTNRSVRGYSTRPRVAVAVGAGFARFPRRTFVRPFVGFGFYPYGYYWPYHYGPYYGPYYPGYAYGYGYGGEVKLSVEPKFARVYVDGAFTGNAEDLKHLRLKPGTYDLSISAPGRASYRERIYVLSGKTLNIKVTLEEARKPSAPTHAEEDR